MTRPDGKPDDWIDDVELKDLAPDEIKWAFSHIDGREDTFNEKGQRDIIVIVSREAADELATLGWTIKAYERQNADEGDEPEYTFRVRISYKFEAPRIYLIKGRKKIFVDNPDMLNSVRRDNTRKISLIATPSRWTQPGRSGVSAYIKEMYIEVEESRLEAMYADYEDA